MDENENPRRNEMPLPEDDWISAGFMAAAKADLQGALAIAVAMPNLRERDQAIAGVLKSGAVAPTDIPALLAACPPQTQSRIIEQTVSAMPLKTPADFAAATEVLIRGPASERSLHATQTVAFAWARNDWEGGWQWADSLPDLSMRRKALASLVGNTPYAKLEQLAARISAVPLTDLSDDLFKMTANRIPEDQRAAWIEKLPADRANWAREATRR